MIPREYCLRTKCPRPKTLKNPGIRANIIARLAFFLGLMTPCDAVPVLIFEPHLPQ